MTSYSRNIASSYQTRKPHITAANKLLENIRADVESARTLITERNSKFSDLEELVHLLKLDNSQKNEELTDLKRELNSLRDSMIISNSSIQIKAQEAVKYIELENENLKKEFYREEVQDKS
jgi:septal ring factor EnvC (AmiA/AmiB activator)